MFFKQLYLLLWKNFTIRIRHPIRTVMEILWPILLFSILIIVRVSVPADKVAECHYPARALPSSGIFPWFQTLMCNMDNPCFNQPLASEKPGQVNDPSYSTSAAQTGFTGVIQAFMTETDLGTNPAAFQQDLLILTSLYKEISKPDSTVNAPISSVMGNTTATRQELMNIGLSESLVDTILQSEVSYYQVEQLVASVSRQSLVCNATILSSAVTISNTAPLDAATMSTQLCNLTADELDAAWESLTANADFKKFFEDKGTELLTEAWNNADLNPAESVVFLVMRLPDLNRQFATIVNKFGEATGNFQGAGDSTSEILTSLIGVNLDSPTGFQEFCGHPSSRSDLSQKASSGMIQLISQANDNSTESYDFCEDLINRFERNKNLSFAWTIFKPILFGKIPYAPDTPVVRNIMERANRTFAAMSELETLSRNWIETDGFGLFGFLENSATVDTMRNVLGQNLSFTNLFKITEREQLLLSTFLSNNETSNVPGTVTWKEAFRGMNIAIQLLQRFLSCVNLDKFEGYPDEATLVEESLTLLENNTFWAGVVFLSPSSEDTNLTKHVKYKIRQDVNDVMRTDFIQNYFWSPGPNMGVHYIAYFINGFADLQDMIDQGITRATAEAYGENTTTSFQRKVPRLGYYLQQMPYPCYESDSDWSPGANANSTSLPFYYYTGGFLFIQDMMERGIASMLAYPDAPSPNINDYYLGQYLQEFPYPCYKSDLFLEYLSSMMSLLMTLAWIYSVCIIIKNIVYEKELRLKEFMKMMGLGNGVHWVSWFINSFYLMLLSAVLLLIVLRVGNVFPYSNPFILLIWMMAFCIATIGQCFLISCFFTKANLAAACGGIIYFMLYVPYNFAVTWEGKLTYGGKIGLSLFSTVAFGFGADFVTKYEMSGTGIQFSNWNVSPQPGEQYTFVISLCMMLADSVIYFLLTWYIEAVFPGKYGIPRPPYFMFTSTYWCGPSKVTDQKSFDNPANRLAKNSVETEPEHLPLGVSIRNLTKIYKKGSKLAVDDLTLNFYEGQITSFLGHNGAGKTTTMSILCGLYTPTDGTAFIHGHNIRSDMELVRENLGMCPQHNVLFGDLTVEEHLSFYAALRGMSKDDIKHKSEKMLVDVNLLHKRDDVVSSLSGGMKRKLSVAVAFTGNSKTVILDEPTAGVDPYARRGIWDLLIKYREGRTIILSTHHMDEADLLGDRIAIISQGKLKCCGSSLYLRSTFGVGYYLTVVKERKLPNNPIDGDTADLSAGDMADLNVGDHQDSYMNGSSMNGSAGIESSHQNDSGAPIVDSKDALDIITKYVPTARIHEENVGEITFILPYISSRDGNYSSLFQALDENQMTYGLTDTSLEEIFLSVADHPKEESQPETSYCGDWSFLPKIRQKNSTCLDKNTRKDRITVQPIQLQRVSKLDQDSEARTCVEETPDVAMQLERVQEDEEEEFAEDFGDGKGSYKVIGQELVTQHFTALFIKRFLHARRNRKGLVAQIILPSIFVLVALSLTLILPPFEGQPSLELQPWMYGSDLYTFYSNDDMSNPDVTSVSDALTNAPGFGNRCVKDYVIDNHVDITSSSDVEPYLYCEPTRDGDWKLSNETKTWSQYVDTNSYEECSCGGVDEKILLAVCPEGAGGERTPYKISNTTDTLFDMTGRDVADWLLKTTDRYIERRYGGLSVGETYYSSFNESFVNTTFDFLNLLTSNQTLPDRENISIFLQNIWRTENAKVWFDNNGFHAMPSYLNIMSNGILRSKLPPGADPTEYSITVFNHPLNYTKQQISQAALAQTAIDTSIAIVVVFAMSFVPASFVVFLIDERVSKGKHLQFISGVGRIIYWITNFVWDMLNYLVPAFIVIIIFLCFQTDSYVSPDNLPCLILLLVLYGWAITPMMYPFSFAFKVSSTAYVVLTCINLFIGINTTLATLILDLLDNPYLKQVNIVLKNVFLIFPQFCLGRGLIDMAINQATADAYARFGVDTFVNPLSFEIAGKNILALFFEGFLLIITLLIEYDVFKWRSTVTISDALRSDLRSDEDVEEERRRVQSKLDGTEILRVQDLSKVYKKGPFGKSLLAVDKMNVAVSGGECFGLLGVNGAGKTTTFKMLTGDIEATAGDATICGNSIVNEIRAVQQNFGYCPQFDALNSHLTGFEHLQLYARLRGVPIEEVDHVARWGIAKLGLKPYAHKTAGTYSGGNKRKLSAAIAFIGCPPIIFLDEPTAGMDPGARRFLWKRILEVLKLQNPDTGTHERCIVLTSHSMEECEALCTRLSIMVNGKLLCIGTPQHLKNKYGKGYTLSVRVNGANPDMNRVERFLMEAFYGAELKEMHHNMLVIQLHPENVKLAEVFKVIEENKADMGIEDYSLSQTTLDEVFVNFAKYQTDGTDDAVVQTNPVLEVTVDSTDNNVDPETPRTKEISQDGDHEMTKISFDDIL